MSRRWRIESVFSTVKSRTRKTKGAGSRKAGLALAFKLTRDVPVDEIEQRIKETNQWVKLIPNTKEASLAELTPAKVSGRLEVPIGRLHKMRMGQDFVTAFTIGDQLLWGAAEPLRRMLNILKK